jgi:hypothetical protein
LLFDWLQLLLKYSYVVGSSLVSNHHHEAMRFGLQSTLQGNPRNPLKILLMCRCAGLQLGKAPVRQQIPIALLHGMSMTHLLPCMCCARLLILCRDHSAVPASVYRLHQMSDELLLVALPVAEPHAAFAAAAGAC